MLWALNPSKQVLTPSLSHYVSGPSAWFSFRAPAPRLPIAPPPAISSHSAAPYTSPLHYHFRHLGKQLPGAQRKTQPLWSWPQDSLQRSPVHLSTLTSLHLSLPFTLQPFSIACSSQRVLCTFPITLYTGLSHRLLQFIASLPSVKFKASSSATQPTSSSVVVLITWPLQTCYLWG